MARRELFAFVLLLAALVSSGLAEDSQDIEISLTDGWKVKRAESAANLEGAFFKKDFDDSAWERVKINEGGHPNYPDNFIFYRRWVEAPSDWKGRKIELSIGEAGERCVVYVDEQNVGERKGRGRICVDVSNKIRCGGRSLIAILCENAAKRGAGMCGEIVLCLPEKVAVATAARYARIRAELKLNQIPFKIVYETYRNDNWELCLINADGSNPVNLTNTPDVDELYPHVSPDGSRLCFLADETVAGKKFRNLYLMNLDGTGRTKIADNAREGCWSADGKKIAWLKGEFEKFTLTDYASKGLFIYDLATRQNTPHPNKELHHLYNLTWTPDGRWFVSTVHGGMGFRHAILAFPVDGSQVFDLSKWKVGGCRPDLSPDGRQLAWGASDEMLMVADINFDGPEPKVTNLRPVAHCPKGFEVYHIDWSPDGRYIAFSHGPSGGEQLGTRAPGWNICVGDLSGKWAPVTNDGMDNKEPDWVPLPGGRP